MKNIIFIIVIALLIATSIFYWHKSRELSFRLELIQKRIEQSKRSMEEERVLRQKAEEALRVKVRMSADKAKIAIVLDDWGYNLKNVKNASELDCPVTFSVLPNLPYSMLIARKAHASGNEVILHLPLEPYEDLPLEKNTIMTDMPAREVLKILEKAISNVTFIKGISNHMGSKATEDVALMSVIFKKMKKDNLYFLDSVVTNKSVCRELSRALGVKFACRSVFLDNEPDTEYIKGQIRELARQAEATGWAVGIGHDRAITISALGEMIPELAEMEVEIVPVSAIAE